MYIDKYSVNGEVIKRNFVFWLYLYLSFNKGCVIGCVLEVLLNSLKLL